MHWKGPAVLEAAPGGDAAHAGALMLAQAGVHVIPPGMDGALLQMLLGSFPGRFGPFWGSDEMEERVPVTLRCHCVSSRVPESSQVLPFPLDCVLMLLSSNPVLMLASLLCRKQARSP